MSKPYLVSGYLDKDNNVVPCTFDVLMTHHKGQDPFLDPRRELADDYVGEFRISTVFICVRHYDGCWFETMVFDKAYESYECRRYKTYSEALTGHAEVVKLVASRTSQDVTDEQKTL